MIYAFNCLYKFIKLKESQTEAPQLLTEADLIALMEKHGIGIYEIHKKIRQLGTNDFNVI